MTGDKPRITFSGHDWENLNRLVALGKFEFLINDEFRNTANNDPLEGPRCAWLASRFDGAALDWVAAQHATNVNLFNTFDGFVTSVRQGFGIAEDNLKALCHEKLDNLRWTHEAPVFFAEIDRLFMALAITGHDTRIAHVQAKLPQELKRSLADQGRQFHNYEVMREWLNTRWALMPKSAAAGTKPKCTNCGKKGHLASECRKSKN